MSAGCFSWCPFSRKEEVKKNARKRESLITKVEAPGNAQYIKATTKEVLGVLQSAAGLIPVPLLKESIGVALKIIQLCEEVSAVEKKAKTLQERVGHLMIVIVDNITAKGENGKESVVEAAMGIQADVEELLNTLGSINTDLGEISAKKRWELVFYKTANTDTLDDCINRLSTALERFKIQLANDLREYDIIREVCGRLEKMANTVDDIAVHVKAVSRKVDNLTENIQDIINRSLAQTPTKEPVREEIPLKPEVFCGRDDMVMDIAQLLVKEETSRVCILGPGGMGKTSVSLAVAETSLIREHFKHSPVWMPCIGATTKDLFLETLYLQLQIAGDKQVTLERIISELNTSMEPRLIIFDNLETPMLVASAGGGTQKGVEDTFRKLAGLKHVAFLVTMRGSRPPCDIAIQWACKNIEPTDEDASLSIFHRIHPGSQNDPDLPELTRVLGHMPFGVTLMANLARDSGSTGRELLSSWAMAGPSILSSDPEQSMDRSISLSLNSNLVKQNPDSVLLLSILSLLPAGTTRKNLAEWWAHRLNHILPTALAILLKAGLLVENKQQDSQNTILFAIPVVQSFMQHERIGDGIRRQVLISCCNFVLSHACRWLDSSFTVNSKILAGEDSNIQSILLDSTIACHTQLSDQYMDALVAFSWHRCDTKPILDTIERALSLARTYGKQLYVASALWCLGRAYFNLSSFELSYKYLQEAFQLFETLPNIDLNLQRLGAQCGIDLVEASIFGTAQEDCDKRIEFALYIESKCAILSNDIHSRSLVHVGGMFWHAGNMQEALIYLERAKVGLTAVGDTSSLGEAWQTIGRVYRSQDQFPGAISAMQEAWILAERSGSLKLQAEIAGEFGEILITVDRITEGWNYLELALNKATIIGARFEIARALCYMGYAYLCQKDYENAYGAFEASAGKWIDGEPGWEYECKLNLEAIKRKQENPHMAVDFLRPESVGGSWYFNPDNLDSV